MLSVEVFTNIDIKEELFNIYGDDLYTEYKNLLEYATYVATVDLRGVTSDKFLIMIDMLANMMEGDYEYLEEIFSDIYNKLKSKERLFTEYGIKVW